MHDPLNITLRPNHVAVSIIKNCFVRMADVARRENEVIVHVTIKFFMIAGTLRITL